VSASHLPAAQAACRMLKHTRALALMRSCWTHAPAHADCDTLLTATFSNHEATWTLSCVWFLTCCSCCCCYVDLLPFLLPCWTCCRLLCCFYPAALCAAGQHSIAWALVRRITACQGRLALPVLHRLLKLSGQVRSQAPHLPMQGAPAQLEVAYRSSSYAAHRALLYLVLL
jgi:hypothetical protein